MQCHQCQHAEDVAAGKFKQVPFEETPCSKCKLEEKPAFELSFDDELPGGLRIEDIPAPEESFEEETRVPISVLTEALALLLSMSPSLRDVLCWRLRGLSYYQIASRLGVTASAVEGRLRRAMESRPLLCSLVVVKALKQQRSKRLSRSNNKRHQEGIPSK